MYDLFNDFTKLINNKDVDASGLSFYIGCHFAELYEEVVARNLDPTVWLIRKMRFYDLETRCATIRRFIPNFNLTDYFKPGDPSAQCCCMRLVRKGDISPDYAVWKWPGLLSLWQMIEIGAAPRLFGLTPEELIEADIATVWLRYYDHEKIFCWYLDNLRLLKDYASSDKSLLDGYLRITKDILDYQFIIPDKDEEMFYIEVVKKAVDIGLMTVDEGVEYLYGIHKKDGYEEGDWQQLLSSSHLFDREFVRNALSG